MNTILKKILRGKKACSPKSELWMEKFNGSMMKGSTEVSRGKYGIVYRGCIDNKCKKYIAYKETRDPSAKMEYTIAKKLEEFGVPKVYLYKECDGKSILYTEYVDGKTFYDWWKTQPTMEAMKSAMVQIIYTLYKIQQKYPGFRHHDLHTNNILVKSVPKKDIEIKLKGKKYQVSNGGVEVVMIDFGYSVWPRIKNPEINTNKYRNIGISRNSHPLYDLSTFMISVFQMVKYPGDKEERQIHNFIKSLYPESYRNMKTNRVKNYRIRGNMNAEHSKVLPDFEKVLSRPFFTGESKLDEVLKKVAPKPKPPNKVAPPKPKTPVNPKNAMARAIAVMKAGKDKKTKPRPGMRRPGIAKPITPNNNPNNYIPLAELAKKL